MDCFEDEESEIYLALEKYYHANIADKDELRKEAERLLTIELHKEYIKREIKSFVLDW
jgi:hypothetical protein